MTREQWLERLQNRLDRMSRILLLGAPGLLVAHEAVLILKAAQGLAPVSTKQVLADAGYGLTPAAARADYHVPGRIDVREVPGKLTAEGWRDDPVMQKAQQIRNVPFNDNMPDD